LPEHADGQAKTSACSGTFTDGDHTYLEIVTMADFDLYTLRAGLRARNRAAAFHLFNPRITLIDLGWKVRDGQLTDELTVRFHVRAKPRGPAFEAFAVRNPRLVLPSEDELDFPVDFIEASYHSQLWTAPAPVASVRRDRFCNPLRGGISISNEWTYGYGTLGGLVKDLHTGEDMILSAWHVLAASAYTRPGLRIFQPGTGDGGMPRHTIARFTRHAMNQGIDAAVARLEGSRSTLNDAYEIGSITGAIEPLVGMRVVKSGRASQVTLGLVSGVEGEQPIWYAGYPRKVRHVVHIMQTSEGGEVSRGGDSGSWWMDEVTHKAAALHFAGSDDPEYALAISMPRILNTLGVEIWGLV
jgi:hypothetical protein